MTLRKALAAVILGGSLAAGAQAQTNQGAGVLQDLTEAVMNRCKPNDCSREINQLNHEWGAREDKLNAAADEYTKRTTKLFEQFRAAQKRCEAAVEQKDQNIASYQKGAENGNNAYRKLQAEFDKLQAENADLKARLAAKAKTQK